MGWRLRSFASFMTREVDGETTEQYYDEEAHQFLADRYITGECPHCHNTGLMATSVRNVGATSRQRN